MKLWNMEQRLQKAYVETNRLLSLHMDLIYTCDLDCTHCYLDDKYRSTLSTEEICDTLRSARDLGAMKLTLSGGELFLRKDLFEIIKVAKELRYYTRLKTHGGRVTAEKAKRLHALGVNLVEISVYAIDPSAHDAIAQRKGAFERTMAGIDHLLKADVPIKVNCSVMKSNKDHYRDLIAALEDRGIRWGLDPTIRGANSGDLSTTALGLELDDHIEVERFKRERENRLVRPMKIDPSDHICFAGRTGIHVQPNGTVTPCVVWPMAVGDLQRSSLSEIWKNAPLLHEIRDTRRQDRSGCQSCVFDSSCRFCPGKTYVENKGEWREPAEIQCKETVSRVFGSMRHNAEYLGFDPKRPKRFTILNAEENQPASHPPSDNLSKQETETAEATFPSTHPHETSK